MIHGYVRTSGDEKADDPRASPKTQETIISRWAGTRPVTFYRDIKFSGGDWGRPAFARMMEAVQRGDTVVCAWQDRFARDWGFVGSVMRTLEKKGVHVTFLDDAGTDTSTRQGKLLVGIKAVVDQDYREVLKEKIHTARSTRGGRWGAQRHTDDEIREFVSLADTIGPIAAARQAGVHPTTFFRWRRRLRTDYTRLQ